MSLLTESFIFLTCVGLWKPVNWPNWKGGLYYIYTFFVIYINISFIFFQSVELIFFNNGIFDFFNNSSMLITVIGMSGKIFTILVNRKKIIKVIHDLDSVVMGPRDYKERKIFTESTDTIRFYTLFYAVFFDASVSVFTLGKIFENRPDGVLPCRAWLPYNYTYSKIVYWITASQQLITIFMSANVDIAHDTLFPGMMLHICSLLHVLKHRFRVMLSSLKKIDDKEKINLQKLKVVERKLFADCVEHHVFILRMVDSVISIFSRMIFIQYSCSSIILCSSVYALSQMKPFSPEFIACLVYISCMFFQIFYFCMAGNRVTLEFSELNMAMYNTNWYSLTNNGRKHMLMMMMCSLKPIVVASGHLVTLSLDSFKNLMKLSYTIFNVFQKSS